MMKVETKSQVLFAVVKIIDWSNVLIHLKYCIWRWLIRWPPALRKCDTNILSIAEYLRLSVLVRCLKKRLYDSTPQTENTAWWSCTDIIVYRVFSPTLVPEAIYGARERGAKRGRGKIASGRILWKSHFHAKPKYRNWTSTMIGLLFRSSLPP